jgi:asparagine N-glycosylation enzyme membrane subunit Stt3
MSNDDKKAVRKRRVRRHARQRQPSVATLLGLDMKWLALIVFSGLAVYAFLLRSLHVFDSSRYYLINPDSYFFHWLAGRVMDGQGPPAVPPDVFPADIYTLHSGLAYPLAYIGKAVASVSDLSAPEALDFACKFLPPLLGIVIMAVIYVAASKIFNRRVALLSSFTWAASGHAILHGGAAGNVDRDVLNLLLVTIGALLFYLSGGWRLRIGGRSVGWLVAGLGILVIEALLFVEWNFVGPTLLLAIMAAAAAGGAILGWANAAAAEKGGRKRLRAAMATARWRTLALVVGVNVVAVAALYSQSGSWFTIAARTVGGGGAGIIDELQGVWARGFLDFASYHFFLIPLALGLYLTWKRRDQGTVFFLSWYLCLVVLSMFSSRVLIYAAPAACLLSGVGLESLWEWGGLRIPRPLRNKIAVASLLFLMILFSFLMVSFMLATPGMTLDEDWRKALTYMRDSSDEDSVVMAWWDHGYWILDVAQRRPVADNGYYGWDIKMMADIKAAYLTTEPEEAAQVMDKYGADFLVFSELDSAPVIMSWPRRPGSAEGEQLSFPEDSLVARVLAGDFESEAGLEVWYTSPRPKNPNVVVLKRTQSG